MLRLIQKLEKTINNYFGESKSIIISTYEDKPIVTVDGSEYSAETIEEALEEAIQGIIEMEIEDQEYRKQREADYWSVQGVR